MVIWLPATFAPDLGGHVYNCRDKLTNKEVFYTNPVIKKDLIGRRGAWIATGNTNVARVLVTHDGGDTWDAYPTPLASGRGAGNSPWTVVPLLGPPLAEVQGVELAIPFHPASQPTPAGPPFP